MATMTGATTGETTPILDPNGSLGRRILWRLGWRMFHLVQWLRTRVFEPWERRRGKYFRVPSWIPTLGNIDNRCLAPAAQLSFDGAQATSGPVVKIMVDGVRQTSSPRALKVVAERLFKGQPRFEFNVCFSCARTGYADPASIWFNVFLGYYQINVRDTGDGAAPFGYRRADGRQTFEVDKRAISAIGEADWNYFSNFFYGVPLARAKQHDKLEARVGKVGSELIAGRAWDVVAIENAEVVSAYAPRSADLEIAPHSIKRGSSQAAFGGRMPRRTFRRAFLPTRMQAQLFVAWRRTEGWYHTYIFGATIDGRFPARLVRLNGARGTPDEPRIRREAADRNAAFLREQVNVLKTLIATEYCHLGFAPPPP